jgi:RNA polymerase sigma-70 factor (ECF subfamily)
MTALEERDIIHRVLEGDTQAFERLVAENERKVYALALKMVGNEEDALDMAQESFVKAFTNLRSFRGDSRFSVWLYRLTYNICIDFIRKRKRTQTFALTYTDEDGETAELEIADETTDPATIMETNQLRKALEECVHALPPHHREIIVMREITGLSYQDIARVLAISEGTVKSRLARARRKLAELLRGNPGFDEGTFLPNPRHTGEKEVETHDSV